MSLLAGIMNPGVQAAQQRLAMTPTAAPAAAATPTAASAAASAPAPSSAGAPAASNVGTTPSDGAAQATLGADALAPPNTKKIIFGSVLRGALTGASLMFGVNKFIPPGSGVANFLLKGLKLIPFLKVASFPLSIGVALGAGALVGGLFGLISGFRKAKKAGADYAAAVAKQQEAAAQAQAPVGDPLVVGPDGKPVAVDPATGQPGAIPSATPAPAPTAPPVDNGQAAAAKAKAKARAKRNPVMGADTPPSKAHGRHKTHSGAKGGDYVIHRGDTLSALAQRWNVSIESIMAANPKIHDRNLIYAGDSLVIPG